MPRITNNRPRVKHHYNDGDMKSIDPDLKYMWRYMDIHKFLSFYFNRNLFMSRLDGFEDLNEAISIHQLMQKYDNNYRNEYESMLEVSLEERQKRYFVNCWFMGQRESLSMWKNYANKSGVAIRVRIKDMINILNDKRNFIINEELVKEIYSIHLGKIHYKNFYNRKDRLSFKGENTIIGFHKDVSYKDENEFRILIKQNGGKTRKFIDSFPIVVSGFKELDIEARFSPYMPEWQKENIKRIVSEESNIKLKNSELKLRIRK